MSEKDTKSSSESSRRNLGIQSSLVFKQKLVKLSLKKVVLTTVFHWYEQTVQFQ